MRETSLLNSVCQRRLPRNASVKRASKSVGRDDLRSPYVRKT